MRQNEVQRGRESMESHRAGKSQRAGRRDRMIQIAPACVSRLHASRDFKYVPKHRARGLLLKARHRHAFQTCDPKQLDARF